MVKLYHQAQSVKNVKIDCKTSKEETVTSQEFSYTAQLRKA